MLTTNFARSGNATKVLAVDDNRSMLTVVRSVLEDDGHLVLTTSNGFRAVELCLAQTIDLVVLDVLMPGLSGIEVGYELRKHTQTGGIPILFCTASAALVPPTLRQRRGVDVLSKPFDAASLQGAVRRLLC